MHGVAEANNVVAGVRRIRLTNFRCYASAALNLDSSVPVVLFGPNGAGKTNLLEAVSYLTPGKGLRNARLSEVARRTSVPFADLGKNSPENIIPMPVSWAVAASVTSSLTGGEFDIGTGCEASVSSDSSPRRKLRLNGQDKSSLSELSEILSAVWITPAMDRIFAGESALRRRFFDRLVQSFTPSHAGELAAYANSYRQWGKLLREGCSDKHWLSALEESMASHGVAIAAARNDALQRIDGFLHEKKADFPRAYIRLSGFLEDLLQSKPALAVEDIFKERLASSRNLYADGGSVVGSHQTDLLACHENGQSAELCSTGQQKALLISLVLAHIEAIKAESLAYPIILFDEAAAHLDGLKRDALLDILLSLPTQSWLTGTEESSFALLDGKAQFFNINDSLISAKEVA